MPRRIVYSKDLMESVIMRGKASALLRAHPNTNPYSLDTETGCYCAWYAGYRDQLKIMLAEKYDEQLDRYRNFPHTY